MADANYQVLYYILCDLIRQESNGKEILIGVYNDDLIANQIPLAMTNLCVRISVRLNKIPNTVNFRIQLPSGRDYITASLPVTEENKQTTRQSLFVLGINPPIILPEVGVHKIYFGLDEPAKEIGFFRVRLPETQAEKDAIAVGSR